MLAEIDRLVEQAKKPLLNGNLEILKQKYNQKGRANYYRLLYLLVKNFQPQVSLEIGVEQGIASCHMFEAAKEYGGIVIGIDILDNRYSELDYLKSQDNYFFIHGDSTDIETKKIVEQIIKEFGSLGLVFQDSSHHYLKSKTEWNFYSTLCKPGTIWLCDDITPAFHDRKVDPPNKGMVEYFCELPGQKKFYPEVLNQGNTQGIVLL